MANYKMISKKKKKFESISPPPESIKSNVIYLYLCYLYLHYIFEFCVGAYQNHEKKGKERKKIGRKRKEERKKRRKKGEK